MLVPTVIATVSRGAGDSLRSLLLPTATSTVLGAQPPPLPSPPPVFSVLPVSVPPNAPCATGTLQVAGLGTSDIIIARRVLTHAAKPYILIDLQCDDPLSKNPVWLVRFQSAACASAAASQISRELDVAVYPAINELQLSQAVNGTNDRRT